jgi:hypothetical protein
MLLYSQLNFPEDYKNTFVCLQIKDDMRNLIVIRCKYFEKKSRIKNLISNCLNIWMIDRQEQKLSEKLQRREDFALNIQQ